MKTIRNDELFLMAEDEELDEKTLRNFITKHHQLLKTRYEELIRAYKSDYPILYQEKKANGKPDNRIVVNFAKYIVDTMQGFFIGIPIKVTSEDKKINDYINFLDKYNDQDDNNAELARITSIYGKAYEFYFMDDDKNSCITYVSPLDGFMIYDDSILQKPLYFVTYGRTKDVGEDGREKLVITGTVYDKTKVRPFSYSKKGLFVKNEDGTPTLHGFQDVPATEYIENEEREAIFESVYTMINHYNKAISEKANDVDYFADAYMKVLGAKLRAEDLSKIRDSRIINLEGDAAEKIIAEFMEKPNADTTQENLLNRLERLIYQISMVANINDENFGNASGISLKYKLQSMSNLAKTKERKFISGMNRRYRVLFTNPLSKMPKDAWLKIEYKMTPNFPANLLEESQIAGNLAGITSRDTQLKVLSIVEDIEAEKEKIEEDYDPLDYGTDFETTRVVSEDELLEE